MFALIECHQEPIPIRKPADDRPRAVRIMRQSRNVTNVQINI
jgi:hypothetical protein